MPRISFEADAREPPSPVEYMLDDHPRSFFPLDTNRLIVEYGHSRIAQYVKEEVRPAERKGEPFAPQLRCYAAKRGLHLRRTAVLDPIAEFFIYDLVAKNRKHFKRDKRKDRCQFGYFFEGGIPQSAMTGYREFSSARRFAESKFKHGLRLDVASYFNSIYHHDLVDYYRDSSWSSDSVQALNRFLGETAGGRSVDCLPHGYHPCKVLGSAFLHIVDRGAAIRSKLLIRFLDDIHLYSNSAKDLDADLLEIQRILGEKALFLNAEKTVHIDVTAGDVESDVDSIKASLLQIRSEWIEVSGDLVEEEVAEYDRLTGEQSEYLLTLLRDPTLNEADAELVLTLLSDHGEEILDRMASVWPAFPSLSRPIYNFVTRESAEPTDVASLARRFLKKAANASEYQLFWLAKMLADAGARDERLGPTLTSIYEHRNATAVVRAKLLEIPENDFGILELRERVLRSGQSDWPSWAAAVGCRTQEKSARNKQINNLRGLSSLSRVIGDVALILPRKAD